MHGHFYLPLHPPPSVRSSFTAWIFKLLLAALDRYYIVRVCSQQVSPVDRCFLVYYFYYYSFWPHAEQSRVETVRVCVWSVLAGRWDGRYFGAGLSPLTRISMYIRTEFYTQFVLLLRIYTYAVYTAIRGLRRDEQNVFFSVCWWWNFDRETNGSDQLGSVGWSWALCSSSYLRMKSFGFSGFEREATWMAKILIWRYFVKRVIA